MENISTGNKKADLLIEKFKRDFSNIDAGFKVIEIVYTKNGDKLICTGENSSESFLWWADDYSKTFYREPLNTKSQTRPIVVFRNCVAYVLRYHYLFVVKDIGKALNRDHTTIVYATQKVQEGIDVKDEYYVKTFELMSAMSNLNIKIDGGNIRITDKE